MDLFQAADRAMVVDDLLPLADAYMAARRAYMARGGDARVWRAAFTVRHRQHLVTIAAATLRSAGPSFARRPIADVGPNALGEAIQAIERFARVRGEWRPRRAFPEPPATLCHDETGAVLGVRGWKLTHGPRHSPVLRAVVSPIEWPRGVTVARCNLEHSVCTRPAGRACVCGIYGFNSATVASELAQYRVPVVGIVRAWGRVAIHRSGWRAEFVQPLWLALVSQSQAAARKLSLRYECDVVAARSTKHALAVTAAREQEMWRWPG